jgi:pilus assembly protein Flp/PilA
MPIRRAFPGADAVRACASHNERHLRPERSKSEPRAIKMKANILQFIRDRRGITAIEYGLIAGVLALGIMTAVGDVATQLSSTFEAIKTELAKAAS